MEHVGEEKRGRLILLQHHFVFWNKHKCNCACDRNLQDKQKEMMVHLIN